MNMGEERYVVDMRIKEHALDLEVRFFTHWSVLSGGTFSLLVPLVQSLKKPMSAVVFFQMGEVFLIISLLVAALGLFASKNYARERSFHGDPASSLSKTTKDLCGKTALVSYALGIIAIAIFIDSNLL
ncbi:MAG: hypothetical protein HYS26_03865 [Candidatus Kaiserbacteria bacterium]|nr:MAG: hypothetical protein HYS26_03865 [Candidatus Kaiserbacteria bacterium]